LGRLLLLLLRESENRRQTKEPNHQSLRPSLCSQHVAPSRQPAGCQFY
jgi:hypothetical protein